MDLTNSCNACWILDKAYLSLDMQIVELNIELGSVWLAVLLCVLRRYVWVKLN